MKDGPVEVEASPSRCPAAETDSSGRPFPGAGARGARRPPALLRALRPHQWAKNALVFVPLVAAHRLADWPALLAAVLAFAAFSLCASAAYVVNDLLDLDADRAHPRKRHRPFASGALPVSVGRVLAPLLLAGGLVLGLRLPHAFLALLLAYVGLTLAYSLLLKRIAMADVVVLAGLYALRILAGGAAAGVAVSSWLLAFSMFLFFGLAMLKRYTELRPLAAAGGGRAGGRGYEAEDLPLVLAAGVASGYLAVLVLALYINSTASEALYRHHEALWLLLPVLLYWTSRAWLLAVRGRMHDDPVVFALTDRVSLALLIVFAGLVALAA